MRDLIEETKATETVGNLYARWNIARVRVEALAEVDPDGEDSIAAQREYGRMFRDLANARGVTAADVAALAHVMWETQGPSLEEGAEGYDEERADPEINLRRAVFEAAVNAARNEAAVTRIEGGLPVRPLTPILSLFVHWNEARQRFNALPEPDEGGPEWALLCAFGCAIENADEVGPADLACKFLTDGGISHTSWFADQCRDLVKRYLPGVDLRR